jgi:hypothetical protein
MTSRMSNSSIAVEDGRKASIGSYLAGHFMSGGVDFEECGPISDSEFKLLMALVVVATLVFGCIVHGWLL